MNLGGATPKREGLLIEKLQEEEKLPSSIYVKGGEKENEHDDRGSMSVSINDKGGVC